MKKILWTAAVLVVLIIIFMATSYLLSPPGAGEELAQDREIPFPAVIAHRGASGVAPESTTIAYELARDMGADYLEADLQRTKDGEIIAFHDDTPARVTDASEVFPGREDDYIETFTYEELLQLDAGSWFNREFPEKAREEYEGLQVITLEELIDIVESGNNNPGLYLETKSAPRHPGIEKDIVRILEKRGWLSSSPEVDPPDEALNEKRGVPTVNLADKPSRIIFQSFYPASISELQELAPQIPRVLLISPDTSAEQGWRELLSKADDYGDGIGPNGFLAWPWNLRGARERNLLIHPYVINRPWQMHLMQFFGADGIFTDYPELALEVYGKSEAINLQELRKK